MLIGADLGEGYRETPLCPKCHNPFVSKCWRCGYGTDDYVAKEKQLTGDSSDYYKLPEGCKELQDLIEYKNMNFARGNVFKAAYRLGDKPGTNQIYDWEKIIWFAKREIQRLKGTKDED